MLNVQRVPELDLHGVRHEDVPKKIDDLVYENKYYSGIGYVITGRSQKMKNVAMAVLKSYFEESMFSEDIFNDGRIKINFN